MTIKNKYFGLLLAATGVVCMAGLTTPQAVAAEITTTGFGTAPTPAPANPYGGSGIPANTSEWTETTGIPGANSASALDTIVLDQAATQYRENAAPGNNGAGTYYVTPGVGTTPGRSTWNFDFNVSDSQDRLGSYTFDLTELNVGNGESASFDPTSPLLGDNPSGPGGYGNSESLDFLSFGGPIGYNINANDTYVFTLTADLNGIPVASDTITVVDGKGAAVPDTAATSGLLAGIFPLLILVRRWLARPVA